MIVTLTLNPSIDYILQAPELQAEDTMRAKIAFFQAGGKGINVSRVLTRLKVANTAWGFCGGDTGRWLGAYLDEEGGAHTFVPTVAETRINVIITEKETHRQLRISAPGSAVQNSEEHRLVQQFKEMPKGVSWIALGGSLPPGIEPGCIRRLIECAREQGIQTLLDADGDVLKEGLKGHPTLIKPNQYELARLLGRNIEDPSDIAEAAHELIHTGQVDQVAVSMAQAGALLVTADSAYEAKAPTVPVLSKVGAGDSMVAGLLKGFLEQKPMETVLRMGVAAGTATVMTPANELCQPHDFEMLLPQVDVWAIS